MCRVKSDSQSGSGAAPADPELPASWRACAVLLPHARAVLALISGGIWRIAQALGHGGSYPARQRAPAARPAALPHR
jgi:hypothetical protein